MHRLRLRGHCPGRAGPLRFAGLGLNHRKSAIRCELFQRRKVTGMTTAPETSQKPLESGPATAIPPRGKLAYLAMLAGAIVLAATGIGTFLLGRAPMTHWVLMAHVSAAPLFAVGLASVALTWADYCRFGRTGIHHSGPAKALLWLILALGLIVILSGVVPMTPLFGTTGQHTLYLTHRYSAIGLAVAVLLHRLSLLRA